MTLQQFIKDFTATVEHLGHLTVHRGFTKLHSSDVSTRLPFGFHFKEGWEDAHYRRVWTSHADYCIVTFHKGDITIEKYDTRLHFLDGLKKAAERYANIYRERLSHE